MLFDFTKQLYFITFFRIFHFLLAELLNNKQTILSDLLLLATVNPMALSFTYFHAHINVQNTNGIEFFFRTQKFYCFRRKSNSQCTSWPQKLQMYCILASPRTRASASGARGEFDLRKIAATAHCHVSLPLHCLVPFIPTYILESFEEIYNSS